MSFYPLPSKKNLRLCFVRGKRREKYKKRERKNKRKEEENKVMFGNSFYFLFSKTCF